MADWKCLPIILDLRGFGGVGFHGLKCGLNILKSKFWLINSEMGKETV